MNHLNTIKKLIGALVVLLSATSMTYGQSESSIEFTIPYADATQQAEVEAMGGDAVSNLTEGFYTLVSTKRNSAKSLKGGNSKNTGLPLEVDCANITDMPLECRADLPPVDFDLPIIVNCTGNANQSAVTIIPGDSGCPGDEVTITRTYFIQDETLPADGSNMAQCDQTFTVVSNTNPTITCPPDLTLDCFTDDTDPGNTGMAVGTVACGTPVVTFSDVSTQVADGSLAEYNYTITRTWTVTDFCGRTASCDQIITVASTDECLRINGIPTMGQWALFILALLMSSLAIVFIRKNSVVKA